jgi:hypothetical protein
MSKGQNLSHHQQGIVKRYYDNQDNLVLGKLSELASELYVSTDDPKKSGSLWKSVGTALKKSAVDPLKAARIVNERKVEELAALVQALSQPGAKILADKPRGFGAANAAPSASLARTSPEAQSQPSSVSAATPSPVAAQPISPDTLKNALHAFKKRLKLTRLEEESRLGSKVLTGGRKSATVAIQPPRDYPQAVWNELASQGKIKTYGSGLYELIGGP